MAKKQSVEQFVYNTLKSSILTRKLAPGTQLVEIPISEQLNISRTPVRNAIRKLAREQLVNIIPNKGAFVVNPSKEEIEQAYELRSELEIMAAKKSVHMLLPEDFTRMNRYLEDELEALENKNLVDYLEANKNFHLTIIEKCGNKFLIEFIEKLMNETQIYLILFDTFFEELPSPAHGPEEHKLIVSYLQKQDLGNLENILNRHYKNAIASLAIQPREYKSVQDLF